MDRVWQTGPLIAMRMSEFCQNSKLKNKENRDEKCGSAKVVKNQSKTTKKQLIITQLI